MEGMTRAGLVVKPSMQTPSDAKGSEESSVDSSTVEEFHALRNEYGAFLLGEAEELAGGDAATREILTLVALQFLLTAVGESTLARWKARPARSGRVNGRSVPPWLELLSWLLVWASFGFQMAIGLLSAGWRRPQIPRDVFDEVFVSTEDSGPANKRLFEYMDSLREDRPVLWLNLRPGRDARPRAAQDGRVVECRPWCWHDIPAATRRYATAAPHVRSLLVRAWPFHRPRTWVRCMVRSCRNLARGCWVAETSAALDLPRTVRCVFSLLKLDAAILEQALRSRGISTIHWLHGTVEMRHHFAGFADWCVAMTPADADVRRTFGFYRNVTVPDTTNRLEYEEGSTTGGILLLTNLLHTSHRLPETLRLESLKRLLKVMRKTGEAVTWRPHPVERASPRFAEFATMAGAAGIVISSGGPLSHEIQTHRWNVCTFSGVIGDVLAQGRLPFVWAEVPYERIGLWAAIPPEVEFRDILQWERIRDLSVREKKDIFSRMIHPWGIGIPRALPSGFFRGLPLLDQQ
jgi:hypothetical protein